MPLPTDSSHLSSQPSDELIEQFTGLVEKQFAKASIMRNIVNVKIVKNTDTLINRRLGKTSLTKVTAGVRPSATATNHGRVSVTVDTIIMARDNQDLLNQFQSDFDLRSEIAEDQGKELGKFFDEAFIIQAIKGSFQSAPTNLNGAIGAGKNFEFGAANDENDPDKLDDAINDILVEMQEEDIDTEECVVLVRPSTYRTLLKHDKLVDMDFSGDNGDYAQGRLKSIGGCRIISTARIPTEAVTGHLLSNSANGNAYDISAAESDAVAVIIHPRSLLAGETIPLYSKRHYCDKELQWFVDSIMAFGVTVNRPDACGAVFKHRA